MKTLGSLLLGAACIALLLAPSAQAHKLTAKQAKAALSPLAAEMAPQVASKVAAKLPGATVVKTGVIECDITGGGHRADCLLSFQVTGTSVGDAECLRTARAQFRSKKSKKLKVSVLPGEIACLFFVE